MVNNPFIWRVGDFDDPQDFIPKDRLYPMDDDLRKKFEAGDFQRVGGGVVCERCGKQYYDHKPLDHATFLTVLCDRSLVKL